MKLYSKEQPPASWENWPNAGGTRNTSLFQRPTWAPAMVACGGSAGPGGAWTTPDVCSGARDMSKIDPEAQKRADTKRTTGLPTEVAMWLTPNVPNGGRSVSEALVQSKGMTPDGEKKTVGLESQTRYWATPDCNTSTYSNGRMGPNLREQTAGWPTPRATDGTKGGPNQQGSKGDLMLPSAAAQFRVNSAGTTSQSTLADTDAPTAAVKDSTMSAWPTPAARDAKGPNSEVHVTTNGTGRMHMDQLANFVAFSPLVQPIPDGQTSSPETPSSRRHLNPLFGSWLMGWPSTWTIAEPHASSASATALFRWQLQQQLSCFFDGLDS